MRPSPLQNLKLAVERCRLTVAGALFAPYASGLSVLTPDEMQLGATVIDMGGGATAIAVFLEGALVHADVVPLGGFNVTADIARVLFFLFVAICVILFILGLTLFRGGPVP